MSEKKSADHVDYNEDNKAYDGQDRQPSVLDATRRQSVALNVVENPLKVRL